MNEDIINDVNLVMRQVYDQTSGTEDTAPDEEEAIIHVHHFPDAQIIELPDGTVLFRKNESTTTNVPIVESTPAPATTQVNQPPMTPAYLMVGIFIFLMLSSILFQLYVILNPLTITVTIAARSQQVSLTGTLQLGRVLNPITLSQSVTIPTTGKGHQDAKQATGYITFYNASFSSQTVTAGIVLTGADGRQVVTDETVTVPPNNPPQDGQATVSAHAINAGSAGNIQALDINDTVSSSLFVKNLNAFTGGQDERSYQTVAKSDIDNAAAPLQADLAASVQGALQGQLKQGEQLQSLPCSPTVTPDHQIGQEATTVKVTVAETCSGIAYNDQELTDQVTQLLTAQARKKLGAGYSMLENPQITVSGATPAKHVMLSFTSVSTWIYALSSAEQKSIKKFIAGKYTQNALQLLHSLPGIERVSLQFTGFGDDTRIPKDIAYIHLLIFYGL